MAKSAATKKTAKPKAPKGAPVPPGPDMVTMHAPSPLIAPARFEKGKEPKAREVVPLDESRDVIYPEYDIQMCYGPNALTVDQVKELVGYEVLPEGAGSDAEYLYKDKEGKKVLFSRNDRNRPFNQRHAETLAQSFLSRQWRFNGEPIIVGCSGIVLSAQHRCAAFLLADQIRRGLSKPNQKEHWDSVWGDDPFVFETAIVFGISEDPETRRTLDNGRPRSIGDTLFAEGFAFISDSISQARRKNLCRMAEYAIRFLFHRTGAEDSAFSAYLTQSTALDFAQRHARLFDAVLHIEGEAKETTLSKILGLGYCAGLMYLMGTSATDPEAYFSADPPREGAGEGAIVDFDRWSLAEEFWTLLCNGASFRPLTEYLLSIGQDSNIGHLKEVIGTLCKMWNLYIQGEDLDVDTIALDYETDGTERKIVESYDMLKVGGLDKGPGVKKEKEVKPEEVQEGKEEEKEARVGHLKDPNPNGGVPDPDADEGPAEGWKVPGAAAGGRKRMTEEERKAKREELRKRAAARQAESQEEEEEGEPGEEEETEDFDSGLGESEVSEEMPNGSPVESGQEGVEIPPPPKVNKAKKIARKK